MSVKSEVSNWKCSTFLENKNYKFSRNDILDILTKEDHPINILLVVRKTGPIEIMLRFLYLKMLYSQIKIWGYVGKDITYLIF